MKSSVQIACCFFLLWCTASAEPGSFIYPTNPAIVDDAVYVSGHGVSRFQRRTLTPVWHVLAGLNTLEPVATPTAILVGSTTGLHALDPATGRNLWHIASKSTLFSPAVANNIAYIGGIDGSVRAVSIDTGHVVWRRDYGGWIYTPAIFQDRLVVGGKEGVLRGIHAKTGDRLWKKVLAQELVYRPVAAPGGRVVATLFSGEVLMIDASDGKIRWRVKGETPSFPPAISNGRLYFGTFDGRVQARALSNGHLIWEQQLNGRLHYLPHIINGIVLVGTNQAELAAYDATTGKRLWHHKDMNELIAGPVVINNKVISFTEEKHVLSWPASFLGGLSP